MHKIASAALLTLFAACNSISVSFAVPGYGKLLFYPDYPSRYDEKRYNSVESLQGFKKETLEITLKNGKKLNAWLFRNPDAKRIAIVSHGNAGNISSRVNIAGDLLQQGVSVILYDYEGFGLSDGSPTIAHICKDGIATYDYVHEKLGYAPEEIIMYGESLGCAVACDIAKHRKCGALILQSGFSSLKAAAAERFVVFHLVPQFAVPFPTLDSAAFLRGEHPPLLLIHGTHDHVLPVTHSKRLFAIASDPKRFVELPASRHSVSKEDHTLYMDSIKTFLSDLPVASTTASNTSTHDAMTHCAVKTQSN
jgi:hypothetical protein